MTTSRTTDSVSRRTTLAALAGGGLGLALFHGGHAAAAQNDPVDFTDHPLTGTWLAMANPPLSEDPQIPVPSYYGADGSVLLMFPLSQAGTQGVQFNSACVGTWEPFDERTGHFTAVQCLSDATGAFLGTITIDGYPMVNEDGQTFIDDGSRAVATIRDPAGTVVQTITGVGDRPVTGIRMGVGAPGFPEATPEAGTPAT